MKKTIFLLLFITSMLLSADSNARRKLEGGGGGGGNTPACPTSSTTIYVDASVINTGTGTRTSPFKTLEEALHFANSCEMVTAIRIAEGIYKPTAGNGREKMFFIGGGYTIRGGYAAGGGFTISNPGQNPTILDGDIGTPGDAADNCYHVLVIAHDAGTVNIEGVQVRNGNADVVAIRSLFGGQVSLDDRNGGGVYITSSDDNVNFTNCAFTGNNASARGGALWVFAKQVVMEQCILYQNTASFSGGSVHSYQSDISYFSCTSYNTENTAERKSFTATSYNNNKFVIQNSILVEGLGWSGDDPPWSIDGDATVDAGHSIMNQDMPGTGMIEPIGLSNLFSNISDGDGPDNKWFTDDDGLRPKWSSVAINRGRNDKLTQDKDVTGELRIYDVIADIGAYEYQLPAIPPSANSLADGLSFSGPYFSTFVYGGSTAIVVGSYAMAAIQPAPGGMLYGEVRTKVFFENSNKFSDRHYVNRHYQVGPVTEIIGNTSPVAKLTLYFTQEEFDAYNAAVGTKADHLPTGPNDDANIASIRIHQFYGSSTNGTGLPGTYENGLRIIDPEDMDIKWHFARNLEPGYWSVSFNVYRFSGFFVFADGSALPVHFGDITAAVSDNRLSVNWTTLTETGNDHFEIEASVDGVNFVTIGSAKSLADSGNSSTVLKYSFSASLNDLLPGVSVAVILLFSAFPFKEKKRRKILLLSAFASLLLVFACEKKEVQPVAPESVLFVRIKQVDKDGSFEYSKTIQVVKE